MPRLPEEGEVIMSEDTIERMHQELEEANKWKDNFEHDAAKAKAELYLAKAQIAMLRKALTEAGRNEPLVPFAKSQITEALKHTQATAEAYEREVAVKAIEPLREACGYVENGTSQVVRISQDDATRDWVLTAGKRSYYGKSFGGVLAELRATSKKG